MRLRRYCRQVDIVLRPAWPFADDRRLGAAYEVVVAVVVTVNKRDLGPGPWSAWETWLYLYCCQLRSSDIHRATMMSHKVLEEASNSGFCAVFPRLHTELLTLRNGLLSLLAFISNFGIWMTAGLTGPRISTTPKLPKPIWRCNSWSQLWFIYCNHQNWPLNLLIIFVLAASICHGTKKGGKGEFVSFVVLVPS